MKKKVNNEEVKVMDDLSKKSVFTSFFSKKKRRIATVFLYERIGKNEVFKGAYPLLKGNIKDLGEYVVIDINGKIIFMDVPHYNDYTPSHNSKIGKILEVVKFAEDDFRVRGRLNETYVAEKEIADEDTKEVCSVCDALWEKCICSNKDEENKLIVKFPKKNKDGTIKFIKKEVRWEEPKGVTQEGRDSIRAMNNYQRRMEEHRKKVGDFWDKYGKYITLIIAIVFATGITCYSIYKVNENLKLTVKEVRYATDNAQWWKNPQIIGQISDAIMSRGNESVTPPS